MDTGSLPTMGNRIEGETPVTIQTVGYEGLCIDDFMHLLHLWRVETVVDVRAIPLSRKRGFSKTALADRLGGEGLGYIHITQLGCPKAIRERWRLDGDWQRYTVDYLAHLQTSPVVQALEQLAQQARASACALLCFEANHNLCHRSLVAQTLKRQHGFEVNHIPVVKAAAIEAAQLELV